MTIIKKRDQYTDDGIDIIDDGYDATIDDGKPRCTVGQIKASQHRATIKAAYDAYMGNDDVSIDTLLTAIMAYFDFRGSGDINAFYDKHVAAIADGVNVLCDFEGDAEHFWRYLTVITRNDRVDFHRGIQRNRDKRVDLYVTGEDGDEIENPALYEPHVHTVPDGGNTRKYSKRFRTHAEPDPDRHIEPEKPLAEQWEAFNEAINGNLPADSLTHRDRQMLFFISQRWNYARVGESMEMTENAVKKQVTRIRERLKGCDWIKRRLGYLSLDESVA